MPSAMSCQGWQRMAAVATLQVEQHWFHKGHVVLKFAGVESISDAERLAGMELQIPEEQRAPLEDGRCVRQRPGRM